jgi:hypothetical protein
MLESVTSAVIRALRDAEIEAVDAFESVPVDDGGVRCCVYVKKAQCSAAGFGEYIGLCRDSDGQERESYAKRCEIVLGLDIYAPMTQDNGARACMACFDRVFQALAGLKSGLKIRALGVSRVEPDDETGLFLCRGEAEGTAYLVARQDEESGELTDFILKGDLKA